MPVTIKIDTNRKIAVIKATGLVTGDEMLAGDRELYSHPDWRNGYGVLADFTEVERLELPNDAVARLVTSNLRNNHLFDRSKMAVAAGKDLVFGLARMWDILAEDLTMQRGIFRDVDSAMDWLKK